MYYDNKENYMSCLYEATGKMKKYNVDPSGKGPGECKPFIRQYPWNPQMYPKSCQNYDPPRTNNQIKNIYNGTNGVYKKPNPERRELDDQKLINGKENRFYPLREQFIENFDENNKELFINWRHQDATNTLYQLIKQFGTADVFDMNEGGIAIWLNKSLKHKSCYGAPCCFHEIILRDESIPHKCPKPHNDFLYTSVNIDINPNILMDVLSLSGSVSYDPLKKLLSARCGSLDANIATLKIATDIVNGKITINEVHQKKLYQKHLTSTFKDPRNTVELYHELCKNLKTQLGDPESSGYWKAAFNEKCDAPNQIAKQETKEHFHPYMSERNCVYRHCMNKCTEEPCMTNCSVKTGIFENFDHNNLKEHFIYNKPGYFNNTGTIACNCYPHPEKINNHHKNSYCKFKCGQCDQCQHKNFSAYMKAPCERSCNICTQCRK